MRGESMIVSRSICRNVRGYASSMRGIKQFIVMAIALVMAMVWMGCGDAGEIKSGESRTYTHYSQEYGDEYIIISYSEDRAQIQFGEGNVYAGFADSSMQGYAEVLSFSFAEGMDVAESEIMSYVQVLSLDEETAVLQFQTTDGFVGEAVTYTRVR